MTKKPNTDEILDERTLKLARETLTGDIRDVILNAIKNPKGKPWGKQSEAEQRDTIYNITFLAESVVRRTATIIAADGRKCLRASVNKITIGDSIQLALEVSKFDPERHALADSSSVLIVMDGIEAYRGERAPAKPQKDQPPLFDAATGEIHEPPPGLTPIEQPAQEPPRPNGTDNQPTA